MSVRFKSFADLWPQGVAALAESLKKAGFEVKNANELPAFPGDAWKKLSRPRSSEANTPSKENYGYVLASSKTKLHPGWGLLLAEERVAIPHDEIPVIRVKAADAAMDFILRQLSEPEWSGENQAIPKGVRAEAGVMIGPECQIGEGTLLEAGVRLGTRVKIGRNCRIGAHTRIADDCIVGDECQITGLVSIGGQGFGFVKYPGQAHRIPRLHVGRVIIGDRVRIGALVSIDRGVFEDTHIEHETALDNIVQIGHNSTVGKNGIICAFVGLSGSTRIGDRVTIAGMTGTKDHVRIGNDVTIAAQSGVSCDIHDGQTVKGYPPRPLPEALKLQVLLGKIPELYDRVKKLEDKT